MLDAKSVAKGRLWGSVVAVKGSFGTGHCKNSDGVSSNSVGNATDLYSGILSTAHLRLVHRSISATSHRGLPDIVSRRRRGDTPGLEPSFLFEVRYDDGSTGIGPGCQFLSQAKLDGSEAELQWNSRN